MLLEVFLSALGGVGVALAIAAYLARAFFQLQTDKILARHNQALALEKERLSHELAVEFHRKSLTIARREQDRVEALKTLYDTIVDLNTVIVKIRSLANIRPKENFRAAYFTALSNIFTELSSTFNRIVDAHRMSELKAVYLDADMEDKIRQMILAIQRYYDKVLAECNELLAKAQSLGDRLSETTQPKPLLVFCTEVVAGWNDIVAPNSKMLKDAIRTALMA